jgi:hypothetical protein
MTPKEKAEELFKTFEAAIGNTVEATHMDSAVDYIDQAAIKAALMAANEVIKVVSLYNDTQHEKKYWDEVKLEIEKL